MSIERCTFCGGGEPIFTRGTRAICLSCAQFGREMFSYIGDPTNLRAWQFRLVERKKAWTTREARERLDAAHAGTLAVWERFEQDECALCGETLVGTLALASCGGPARACRACLDAALAA